MKRVVVLFPLIVLLFLSSACSEKKPPTESATKGSSVVGALRDLSHMFEKKNLPGFMNLIADNFKDRQAFSASLADVFKKYETVRFTVQYTKMVIMLDEKGAARADFNWDSEWQTAGGSVQKNSGRVTFTFDPKSDKLAAIDGKSPFIPQAAENPGMQ